MAGSANISSWAAAGHSASSHMCAAQSMYTQPLDAHWAASSTETSIERLGAELRAAEAPRLHDPAQAAFQQVRHRLVRKAAEPLGLGDPAPQPRPEGAGRLHRLVVARQHGRR